MGMGGKAETAHTRSPGCFQKSVSVAAKLLELNVKKHTISLEIAVLLASFLLFTLSITSPPPPHRSVLPANSLHLHL